MNQHLADLVGGVGVFAFLGVVVLKQELAVAVFDDGLGVGLDFVHHAQRLGNLGVECGLGAEEDVAVGVGGFVAVIHQLGVGADLAAVAGDELEQAQDAALVHGAQDEKGEVDNLPLWLASASDCCPCRLRWISLRSHKRVNTDTNAAHSNDLPSGDRSAVHIMGAVVGGTLG